MYNGREYKPFSGAFNDKSFKTAITGKRGAGPIPRRKSKLTAIDEVISLINDGDTISYPHYYRTGDKGLALVVKKLREYKKKGIILYGNAFFDHVDPWLFEAIQDGTIKGTYGNPYKSMGDRIVKGEMLPWVSTGFSHGNRVRKLQTGEVHVKVAFGPVPMADIHGNANGVMGNPDQWCGPLGLFSADAEFADYTCLIAGTVSEHLIFPAALSMELVDFVVHIETPGLAAEIAEGTLDMAKIRGNKFNAVIAENVTKVMKAAHAVKDNFNFQVGSGAGLLVLDNIRTMLNERKITANFAIGGVTGMHVDMMREGTLRYIMHGQCFEPSQKVIESLRNDPNHIEITAGYYASVGNKECAVNMLDVAVLSALEVDLGFNVNTVCAGGRIVGGIGGGQDVAAGADLTIMFLPLATGKKEDGKGYPKVVKKVFTNTTPGEVVDVVVTEDYIAVNPKSTSTHKDALLENAAKEGLKLVSIEELHEKSTARALEYGKIPQPKPTTDEVVHLIEWRDGTIIDTIKKSI